MLEPGIIVVTGASGAGKTTLVRALEAHGLPGVSCHYFDSVGVPSNEEMITQFGSANGWQDAMTRRWIGRLQANPEGARVAVLDGQVRISMVRAALVEAGVVRQQVVLVDCGHEVRDARLRGERRQPELASRDMAAWAAYLRGQADALGLPIIDTSLASVSASMKALVELVSSVA